MTKNDHPTHGRPIPAAPSGVPAATGETILSRWGRTMARRRKMVVPLALVVIVLLGFISGRYGGEMSDNFSIPGVESQKAYDLLLERFPQQAGDSAQALFKANGDGASISDPATRTAVTATLDQVRALPHVVYVADPYTTPGSISPDGDAAQATIQFDIAAADIPKDVLDQLVGIFRGANTADLTAAAGGIVVAQAEQSINYTSEIVGLIAAAIILLIAFGSVVAMGLPIITALLALGAGMMGLGLVAAVYDVSSFTPVIATMIGLGVGIDYALFIVTRFREAMARGMNTEDAVARAIDTAGRAVLFAGTVVVIALAGLIAIGLPFISAFGIASSIVVACTILVALTVLPAILAMLGRNLMRLSISRKKNAHDDTGHSPFGYALSRSIQHRPVLFASVAVGFLLLLAAPVARLELGFPTAGQNPENSLSRQAYDLTQAEFGAGSNGVLVVSATQDGGLDQAALGSLAASLQTDGVVFVTEPMVNPAGDTAVITIVPATAPTDPATRDLVANLRGTVIPAALSGSAMTAYVGGQTAGVIDLEERIIARTPIFFVIVIGLSFLILMVVFRSILVPVKAALMNVFSIVAAFGVVVGVFQFGWGADLLAITPGPIAVFMPMFLFAILFGLSMDYEVFLLSRIRESWAETGNTRLAVSEGLAATARVITAAAAIMVAVFVSFVFQSDPIPRQFGLGLAAAVLVDATVVRLILVPSTMELLGERNWWYPRWLDRITPRLNIEGGPAPAPTLPAAANAAD